MEDFSTLYDKHIDELFAFGSRLIADRETLKDCIQDVFVKLFTRKEGLGTIMNVEHYLFISLRNRINDEFRRSIRLCDNDITDAHMQIVADNDEYNREMMERRQTLTDKVESFFDQLSPRQRQIINLYYVEHRKYDDICRIMGINYQSVRNLMHHSISRLRECAGHIQITV